MLPSIHPGEKIISLLSVTPSDPWDITKATGKFRNLPIRKEEVLGRGVVLPSHLAVFHEIGVHITA